MRQVSDDSDWMRSELLVEVDKYVLDAPCDLSSFVSIQAAKSEGVVQKLLTAWHPQLESVVQARLSALPGVNMTLTREKYEAGRIPRVFKQLQLSMQDLVQSLSFASIGAFMQLLDAHKTPDAELGKPTKEWAHALMMGAPPIIVTNLKLLEGGSLEYQPSLTEIEAALNHVCVCMCARAHVYVRTRQRCFGRRLSGRASTRVKARTHKRQVLEGFRSQTMSIPAITAERVLASLIDSEKEPVYLQAISADNFKLEAARREMAGLLHQSFTRPKQLLEL